MYRQIQQVLISLALVSCFLSMSTCREYHYDRPGVPFVSGQQQPPLRMTVRTYEPNAQTFDVSVHNSQKIYEGTQIREMYSTQPVGVNQYQTTSAGYAAAGATANVQNGFYQSQSSQPPLQYTSYQNPLVQYQGQYQSQAGVPQTNQLGGSQYATAPSYQPGSANAYATYTQAQQFGANAYTTSVNQQQLQQQQGFNSQQSNYQQSGQQQNQPIPGYTPGQFGNYVAQSEVGQLDVYAHKQLTPGFTRPYTRRITTCSPGGQCETMVLGPGQADVRHQHVVVSTRTKLQPVADKCKQLQEARRSTVGVGLPPQATQSGPGVPSTASNYAPYVPTQAGGFTQATASQRSQKRPPNRRLFPYSEVVSPQDTFN